MVLVSASLEAELATLSGAERSEMLQELGVNPGSVGRDALLRAARSQLDLISFFTSGPAETRGWSVKAGSTAPQAGAAIHSDFEKRFIRAEVVPYEALLAAGSQDAAKAAGAVQVEGKAYVVNDADVMLFHVGR